MVSTESQKSSHSAKSLILVAWLFVGVPLAWGIYQTGHQSMGLFRATSSAVTPTTMPH
ncbi:MAG TPA: hypothetical protein VHS31_18445 [Tepidisphaeraceae bacterium]|nr:hypothetical protein [Tepidisphaeraceae bacterium]